MAPNPTMAFYYFAEYARRVEVAGKLDWRLKAMVLLGGDAGLRSGELIALEWPLHIPGRPSGKLVIVEVSQPWTGSRQGEKK